MDFTFRSMPWGLAASLMVVGCSREPAPASPPDGGDAQRLAALVDYVGGDYARAVRDGAVAIPSEYEEQLRFVADARRLGSRLAGPQAAADDTLLAHLARLESLVEAKADPADVAQESRLTRELAVARFNLPTTPLARPSVARGQSLFRDNCVVCHGVRGDARTERAKTLDPPPASFRERSRLDKLSPYRVYNALTFGVSGTGMAGFESLSPVERWDLAFYVFRLGHEGEEARGPVSLPLGTLASLSDHEVLESLRAEGHPLPRAGLAYARSEAAFAEPPVGAGIGRARRLAREAAAAFEGGQPADADRLAIDAYLQGFEPIEPGLRARDPAGTQAAEGAFRDLRGAMAQRDRAAVHARADALDALLARMADGERRPVIPFTAAALIFFREGIEAALLVGALLAAVRKLGRREGARYVHVGWVAALPAGIATWWLFERALSFGADKRELMEAVVALTAAAVLFSVSFWMISKVESRHWIAYLKRNVEETVGRRSLFVLAGLSFLAVYREAAETVLFTQALLLESGSARAEVWAGAAAGVAVVVALSLLMSRTVLRLPLGPFFAVSSVLLCGLAISFAGAGMHSLVAAGYLPPRPVRFPEVPWMGIHPDLSGLLVQLSIAAIVAAAGVAAIRRHPEEARQGSH
ncbi:MAG: FTR1 family protein [Vicinamibacteria bacterium]